MIEKSPTAPGLLDLSPARFRPPTRCSGSKDQEGGCLRIGHRPVAGIGELARDPCERVNDSPDRELAPLSGDLQGLHGELVSNASPVEDLHHLFGVVTQLLAHGIPDHVDEAVSSGVAFLD